MKTTNKKSNNKKQAFRFVSFIGQSVLVYTGFEYLLQADNQYTIGVIAFALFWVLTDVALYFYKYIVAPSASAIVAEK